MKPLLLGTVNNIMTTSEEDKSIPQNAIPSEEEAHSEAPTDTESSVKDEPEAQNADSDSEKGDPVDMADVDRASRAAKIAREMAKIKEMKSAYSAGTTIDLTDLTEDSEVSSENTLTEDIPGDE